MISGRTELIAHLGYPTESFTAPMIYNPCFAARGIDAVEPMEHTEPIASAVTRGGFGVCPALQTNGRKERPLR